MENEEAQSISEFREKIRSIFSDFMTRVTKFEELVDVGNRLLVGFRQGLEFLRRSSIDKTSNLVECIIKANDTKRLISYFDSGCVKTHDSVQNLDKLHTCQLGLQTNLLKAKCVMNELECIVEDVEVAMQTASRTLPHLCHEDIDHELKPPEITYDKEEAVSSDVQKPDITEYAVMMAVIYSMVKKDYTMQERVVSSLNLKSSSEELESYCLMWSLRPFIEDDIMHQAWRLLN